MGTSLCSTCATSTVGGGIDPEVLPPHPMLEEITSPRTSLCAHFAEHVLDSRFNSIAMLASPKVLSENDWIENRLHFAEFGISNPRVVPRESYNSTAFDTMNLRAESEGLLWQARLPDTVQLDSM